MKYMGSKAKYAKYLLPYILADRKPGQWYIEPFVGGCNMIDKVTGNRIGGDNNLYLISMWNGLIKGFDRPKITRENYKLVRDCYNKKESLFSDFEIGYVGWMGSFNGRFFDGGYSGEHGKRNYIDEQIRNTEKQIERLRGVDFKFSNYYTLKIPDKSIIYCDPPYMGTKQYSTSANFDHDHFWEWCREQNKKGHKIFVSEYQAPDDFKCIVSLNATNSLNTTKTYNPIEKLFTL